MISRGIYGLCCPECRYEHGISVDPEEGIVHCGECDQDLDPGAIGVEMKDAADAWVALAQWIEQLPEKGPELAQEIGP